MKKLEQSFISLVSALSTGKNSTANSRLIISNFKLGDGGCDEIQKEKIYVLVGNHCIIFAGITVFT